MDARVTIFPGSFDPPHNGHIDLVREALKRNGVDHVVIVATHNPTKKRLLSIENSVAMLKDMLPEDIADRVTVCESTKSAPKLATQFNASSILRGKRLTEKPLENAVHEAAVAAYFTAHRLSRFRKPVRLDWIRNSEDCRGLSSSKLRRILFSDACSQEKLETVAPPGTARLLMQAKARCPDVSKENSADFNRVMAELLSPAAPPRRRRISGPGPA